ncbi:unnamed protein product [Meloidogyne enterolobii]|uniref:Sm domain-containing protein n=2 Tax=Meloidogyne enterolobii TaxID=390850 RepID=A0A6V7WCW1_MELEN|nr:unnamed protein product [Meloidogyne enterolobii]CAD2184836.1 unnamed protein product [Meloidogyne enterolobii]
MGRVEPLNPKPFLNSMVGKKVVVKLKWGNRFRGTLISTDDWMNLHLIKTEELVGSDQGAKIGELMIRYNNVMWIAKC